MLTDYPAATPMDPLLLDVGRETRPAVGVDSVGSGLLGSFNRGALSFKPKAILVGNSYPKMSWTEASYLTGKYDFELLTINDDLERMKKWIGFVPGKPSVSVEHDADEATISQRYYT
ncbi:hypothetical protein FS749_009975 [Ceratobasidium sp. UAMH 11750]|nr:hypothetical protein FS749_009975 [Ceratobasidium sp. UAMH 11750]